MSGVFEAKMGFYDRVMYKYRATYGYDGRRYSTTVWAWGAWDVWRYIPDFAYDVKIEEL